MSEQSGFRLRDVAVTAYGPTLVASIGLGAVTPVLALQARSLGADVGTAAFVVALVGIGSLLTALPAGAVVARVGERRALLVSGLLDAVAMLVAGFTGSLVVLGAAALVTGMTWTTFLIARQGYMIDVVPLSHRARALAGLGGSTRVGVALGPVLGAGLIALTDLRGPFVLAAVTSTAAGLLALLMPDLGSEGRAERRTAGHLRVLDVIREHRRVLLTVGTAVVVISASRSVRTGLLPLWAEHVGLSASSTSLIFAVSGLVDVLLFYPGGWLMDTRGRAVTAVPVVLSVAVACLLLPLTDGALGVAAVAALIAFGNGLGAGIVMTLGADRAPVAGRAQFLGAWRLCGDVGVSGGPLVVSAVTAFAPLAAACVVVGMLGLLGTGWVGYWTRREDRRRLAALTTP